MTLSKVTLKVKADPNKTDKEKYFSLLPERNTISKTQQSVSIGTLTEKEIRFLTEKLKEVDNESNFLIKAKKNIPY